MSRTGIRVRVMVDTAFRRAATFSRGVFNASICKIMRETVTEMIAQISLKMESTVGAVSRLGRRTNME